MKSPVSFLTVRLALAAACLFFCASLISAQSLPGYRAPHKAQPKEESLQTRAAHGQAPLRKLYDHLRPDAAKRKHLPPLSAREKRRRLDKLLQIGVVRTLPFALDPVTDSAEYSTAEGGVKVASVVSEGALYVRLHFKNFSLPAGARVFVYSAANPDFFFGPYEGRGPWNDGTFWAPALPGDQVVIEYTSPLGSRGLAPFTVSQIAHLYKDTPPIGEPAGACNLDVAPAWTEVAKSVGMLQFVTGGLVALCTGTLLNDSNTNIDHYVLTSNHCINSQAEAQSAQIFWNYNSGETPGGSSSFGADLKVSGTASDFSLLRFGGVIPGLFYSGWDANPVATSTGVTGIHHPSGSHKRISFGATNANCPSWLGALCPNFTGVTWNQGVTEPGSSGSGIWTGAGDAASSKLVGTLTGGESSCSNPSGSDYYGRFSVTYPNVSAFLNGTNCVTSISPNSQGFPAAGGTGSFNITAPAGCSWSASSTAAWLTITSPTGGTGNGTINFSVAASSELQRRGSIVVGTQLFNVNQAGGGVCAPTPINYGQTINGTLATSDCPVGDGTYVDAYSFNGTAGQHISILMTSSAFDTYLFLLNPDGSTLRIDDDGGGGTNSRIPSSSGYFTLPATGSYTILANSFDVGATGAYSLTLTEQPKQTLTISSKTPDSGISVFLAPADINGVNNGTTTFGATYYQFTTVILNAQSTAGPNTVFLKWQKDGVDYSTSTGTSVTMDVDHTMTAVYGPTPTQVLTVASENPSGGVPITLTPNDNNGQGGGTTLFTRTYNRFTSITLTAPISAGGNYFQKWRVTDGNEVNVRTLSTFVPSIDRTVTAVYVSVPSLPDPTPTPTPSGPSQAVTYQINPAHTGLQHDSTVPPLAQRWSRNMGQTVSYPLIAGGRVFVTTVTGLHALDATNGATLWSTGDIGTSPAAAYDAGRVFVINYNGLLRAFDASTGALAWSRQLSGQAFSSPPTAVGGTVYVNGYPTLYAVNQLDGTIKWNVLNAGGDRSSPAVSADGVYVAHSCNNTWALSPGTGSVLWHYTTNCFGGGGKTPVLYAGRLYDRAGDHLVLHGSAGVPVATFSSLQAPAFSGATGYFKSGSTLEARDVVSGTLKWSFTGDGTLSSAPIVVNGFVYIGSTSGKLYAVSESSGAAIWTGNVGAPVIAPDEQSSSAPAGLAAGEGLIVVPASDLLVAYHSSPQLITDSNNRVVAMDSVTFVRDPFRLITGNNFSSDQRTRITIFTSNLGITQPSADLSVLAANIPLTIEAVGTLASQPQYSYITVKLDPALPTGVDVQLSVIFRSTTTNAGVITIAP
jgi:outer membrane protein assembly factor BamB